MDKKTRPIICCLQEAYLRKKDTQRLKVKGWRNRFHEKRIILKAGIANLMSDKVDFKAKVVIRDKEGHYIMIKREIQQEDTTPVNIYIPNTEAPKYIKQILVHIKKEIDSNPVIIGYFNTPLASMDKSSRHRINKETVVALNDTLD